MVIGQPAARSILSHADSAHPHEACGLLLGGSAGQGLIVQTALEAPNRASDPHRAYRICDDWLLRQLQRFGEANSNRVIGAYHSHPDGDVAFSRRDAAEAWPNWLYLVTATPYGASPMGAWWVDAAGNALPLSVRLLPG